jgi:pimeloyl-ACP methyl ester carboxylesterase
MNTPTRPVHARSKRFIHLARLAVALALATGQPAWADTGGQTLAPPVSAGATSAAGTSAVAEDVKFVEANGVRFGYVEQGSGPLVLLMHGYPENARSWQVVQQRLAAGGYRVVAPFMRGYLPSGSAKDYTLPTLGRDVNALITALGAERAVVVGHDWGAAAVLVAQQQDASKISALVTLSFPQLGVILSHPQLLLEAPHFLYYQLPWAERLVSADDYAHIDRIFRQWSPSYVPPAEVLAEIKASLRQPGATTQALAYYKALLGAADLKTVAEAASHKITTPSLVIAGAVDGGIDVALFDRMRTAFTGTYRFVKLDGVGHFPQLEAPQAVADAILAFIATNP